MTSARRLHAHARALRAALAVTGSARHFPRAASTLLCCALPPLFAAACVIPDEHHDATEQPPALWVTEEAEVPLERPDEADAAPDIDASPEEHVPDMGGEDDLSAPVGEVDMATPVVPDMSVEEDLGGEPLDSGTSQESCLDEQGHTMWQCCASNRDAIGCDFCEELHTEDMAPACLSCWPLIQDDVDGYTACCQMFESFEEQMAAGCAPWGPPAPPRYRGARLATLMRMSASHPGRHARRATLV